MAGDLVSIAAAMTLAFVLKVELPGADPSAAASAHALLGALSLPVWLALFVRGRLYSDAHTAVPLDELRRLVSATAVAVGVIAAAGFVLKIDASRGWLALSACLVVPLVLLQRSLGRLVLARLRSRGRFTEPVLIVGGNGEAAELVKTLDERPSLGYRAVGFVGDQHVAGRTLSGGVEALGRLEDTLGVAARIGVRRIMIATSALDHERCNHLIHEVTRAGLPVDLFSSLSGISTARIVTRPLGRSSCISIEPVRHSASQAFIKRALDITFAVALGLAVLPFLAVVAVAIKLDSSGAVLFRQRRIGKDGELFEMLKLRTMVSGAENVRPSLLDRNEADGPLFKLTRDPRCTRIGRVLRAFSIDELPQLWNVIRGDMSLVGPRPALPEEAPLWTPTLYRRLGVRPGITGTWQVSGPRRWASFDDYARLDLYYLDNWSLWTDIVILAKTVPAVLLRWGTA